jgi:hypothetical protein
MIGLIHRIVDKRGKICNLGSEKAINSAKRDSKLQKRAICYIATWLKMTFTIVQNYQN